MIDLNQQYTTTSSEETFALGKRLAENLQGNDILLLEGDLGVGKTVFTKGLAEGLGIARMVKSPTFNLVKEYDGRLKLYHFDLYRIEDPEELYEIGFDSYLTAGGVCVIEWPQIAEDFLPQEVFRVFIERSGENCRRITVER